ncbi:MAG: ABC transporter ATP-binding protein [Symbiobacteriia bacterium]
MLEVQDVHTYYGESHVLQGVSLSLEAGQVVALLGRNGAGKTTLIRSIIGFNPPRRGKILLDGREIQGLRPEARSRAGIGLVPQGRRIFPSLTVKEHLRVPARAGNGGQWTVDTVYELFPRLREREDHLGTQLSGGEQQMLAIGRALMTNPRLLLMDEPTEGLAPLVVQEVGRAIEKLAEQKLSIILVEQNLPLALQVSRTAYIVSKGVIVFHGETAELARNEEIRHQHLGV